MTKLISIHPPRVGRDEDLLRTMALGLIFQSTLPVWGGTPIPYAVAQDVQISIHPPRVGRDSKSS